ncbi:hypothetical protein HMSSN036_49850 [Paenibacillus macerans]|nr:hypothetical protein HMSSN036_49850 [Paenibacillus macerans]
MERHHAPGLSGYRPFVVAQAHITLLMVIVNLGTQLTKEAALMKTSSSTVWFTVLDERIEVNEVTVEEKPE